jgi:hypothetical protein
VSILIKSFHDFIKRDCVAQERKAYPPFAGKNPDHSSYRQPIILPAEGLDQKKGLR